MKLKKIHIFFLLLSLLFLQGVDCNKRAGVGDYQPEHTFKETVSLSPYQLDYKVGDTIWLHVNIPGKKLFDQKTGTRVLFDSMLFNSTATIQLLYNNPYLGDGPFAKFSFPTGVSAYTSNYNYQSAAYIGFGCAPGSDYTLTLGIILLQKGVFGLSFSNNGFQQCSTGAYNNSLLTFTFDVTDAHSQFYQQLPFDSIGKKPDPNIVSQLEQKNIVVIRVL